MYGVSSAELHNRFGSDLVKVNSKSSEKVSALDKLKSISSLRPPDGTEDEVSYVKNKLEKTPLDPEVNYRTLGKPHDKFSIELVLDAAEKLLKINRGEAVPDDRDNPVNMMLLGVEDLIAERLSRSSIDYKKSFRLASERKENWLSSVPSGLLTPIVRGLVSQGQLANLPEGNNPLAYAGEVSRVSRMGYGAIGDEMAIPDEARDVNNGQVGVIDPVRTTENTRIGVELAVTSALFKGADRIPRMAVVDASDYGVKLKRPDDLYEEPVAFADSYGGDSDLVEARLKDRIVKVPRDKVRYILPTNDALYSPLSLLIPMKNFGHGGRANMGIRFVTQALPMVEPEAPLVRSGSPDEQDSYERILAGWAGAVHAEQGGQVISRDDNQVSVKYDDGTTKSFRLYRHQPANSKTHYTQTPKFDVGDRFKPGDTLVRSNYTDDNGVIALGKNLRVAYMAQHDNFEDGISISESAAKKLTSDHLYVHQMETDDPNLLLGTKKYVSVFPSTYDKSVLNNFDENGVVKPGTKVKYGDPLVLSVKHNTRTYDQLGRRGLSWQDNSIKWDRETEGTVVDVVDSKGRLAVTVQSSEKFNIADKIGGRTGDKGVVAKIVPDELMPIDEQGRPIEVLLNPLSVQTRGNVNQIYEALLGKVAEATGKPYNINTSDKSVNMPEFIREELRKNGLKEYEDVFDPVTGSTVRTTVGNRYLLKLGFQAEDKLTTRGHTGGFDIFGQPTKATDASAKRFSFGDLNAVLSVGDMSEIRDAILIKGQDDQNYWRSYIAGADLPKIKEPIVNARYFDMLKAAGINMQRTGSRMNFMAMTDKDIDELAGDRVVDSGDTVNWKNMKPIEGGLFDERIFAGHNGNRWAKINLHGHLPSPIMEAPIRKLLNLTEAQYRAAIAGKQEFNGFTGPDALKNALSAINIDEEIEKLKEKRNSKSISAIDSANKALEYLIGAKRSGVHPKDWMISKIPVLPTALRPVSVMADSDVPLIADPNYLYKELIDANSAWKSLSSRVTDLSEERLTTYDAMKAVTGLGDPINQKTANSGIKGVLKLVFGDGSPKWSLLQRRVLSKPIGTVGKGVIIPNSDLDMDTLGVPEPMAWDIFRPYGLRSMTKSGLRSPIKAAEEWENRTPFAKKKLNEVMSNHTVKLSRAPLLHAYGHVAQNAVIVPGNSIQLSPLIIVGLNADFDGDTVNVSVDHSDQAIAEARAKHMPSKMLLHKATFESHMFPKNEFAAGLYEGSTKKNDNGKVLRFETVEDMISAYRKGRFDVSQRVEIMKDF
jgi:hypothetical protein